MGMGMKVSSAGMVLMLLTTTFFMVYDGSAEIFADAGSNQNVDTNVEIEFNASDSRGTELNFTWMFRDGSIGYGINPAHSFRFEGIFEVSLTARDIYGQTAMDSVTVTVQNTYPQAHAGIDRQVYEDELVVFDASGTIDTPNDENELIYSWDFGDGYSSSGMGASHTYTKSGLYNVIMTATDNNGAVNKDIISVEVLNRLPLAGAGSDMTGLEDSTISFDASASSDTASDDSRLSYSWDFGDGSVGEGVAPDHIYTKAGTYTVKLLVMDDDGASATDLVTVTIRNAKPTAFAGSDYSVKEDEPVFFGGTGQDTVSDQPILEYRWDFGDGNSGTGKNPIHSYLDMGTYAVTLIVTDDDGATGTDSLDVIVTNVGPSVWAGPDIEVNEDVPVQFEGIARDSPSDERDLKFTWQFGDSTTGSGKMPVHTYSNEGMYIVTLTVTDDNSVIGTDYLIVIVYNVPPTALATYTSPNPTILAGDVITFYGESTDSNSDLSTLSYHWDFGDGYTATGKTVTHSYSTDGIYQVTLTVEDDDGDKASDTVLVLVERHSFEMDVSPSLQIMPGETAEYIITISNTGTIDEIFELELTTSIDPAWIEFVTENIAVPAGSFQKIFLNIVPPEDFPLDCTRTDGFSIFAHGIHTSSELSNAPLTATVSEELTVLPTYESRLRKAQLDVDALITDHSGGNSLDATLLKALEEISEALFFGRTDDSPDFDYVKSYEHIKSAIQKLDSVSGSVSTGTIIDLLLITVNDGVKETITIAEVQANSDNIHVIDAWQLYDQARSKVAAGDYPNAIERYKSAYMEAERAEGEWIPREYTKTMNEVIDEIDILLAGSYSAGAKTELQDAKDAINNALDDTDHGLLQDSFVDIKEALGYLQSALNLGVPTTALLVKLTGAVENAVYMLIKETETHVGLEVNDIKQAWSKFKKGQEFSGNGQYLQAVDKFDRAFTHALNAEDWIPIADSGPDQSASEDEVVYFDASNSRDRDGIVLFYEWDLGDGAVDYGVRINHSYTNAGLYNVTLLVIDNEGERDIDVMTVLVRNIVPTAGIVLDYIPSVYSQSSNFVFEDDIVIFHAVYSDTPSDLPELVFQWDFGDGSTGTGAEIKHVYTFKGVYTVLLTVIDEDGDVATARTTIIVENVNPKSTLTFSQVVSEDEVVYFSGYGEDSPSDQKTLSYTWDFGDGSTGTGEQVTHVYTNKGIYSVTFTVTDIHGSYDRSIVRITVLNPWPVADAGWTQYGDEDSPVTFFGTGQDTISDQASLTYYWDFGDGNSAWGVSQTNTYSKAGTYIATLAVVDDNGGVGIDRIQVNIENEKPGTGAGTDLTRNEDVTASFAGTGSDTASDQAQLTYSWEFGDGSVGYGKTPTHVYTQAGTYKATLTVTDDDGDSATDFINVTVYNVIPGISIGSDHQVDEDELVIFNSDGTDTASDEPLLTFSWDFGDGTSGYGRNPTHTYTDSGRYTVRLTVTDDNGASYSRTMLVEVDNVVPIADAGPDLMIYAEPSHLYLQAHAFDTPSDQADLTYNWDFGDGETGSGIFVEHMYVESGVYDLTLTVTDDNGESVTDTAQINYVMDSDGDGLSDELEDEIGTDKESRDSDMDGIDDYEEVNPGFDGFITNATNKDTDGDGIEDWEEVYPGLDTWMTNPTKLDTDDDSLDDKEEIYVGDDGYQTDPTDPDSDDDGLIDGNEKYYIIYKSQERMKIKNKEKDSDSTKFTSVPLANVIVSAPSSNIVSVYARVGITHDKRGDLDIYIQKGTDNKKLLLDSTNSDSEMGLFTDFDLLKKYNRNDFKTMTTWTLQIGDISKENGGFLEYFELSITARTDPNKYSSDSDNLNDSEEVELGSYGWFTDPWDWDTDNDRMSDSNEIINRNSNPKDPDTDRDGVDDYNDTNPFGNTGVKVTVKAMHVNNTADEAKSFPPEPFAYITVGDFSFPTVVATKTSNDTEMSYYDNLNYHFTTDIADDKDQIDIILAAYEHDGSGSSHVDKALDITSGDEKKYKFTYDIADVGQQNKISGDTNGYDKPSSYMAKLKYSVETVNLERITTIILNGTGSGLYETVDGKFRWTGESEFYSIILKTDTSAGNSVFKSSSWYTIIVPRSVFIESYFNKTINDGSVNDTSSGMKTLEFSKQSDEDDSAQRNIVQVITGKDITPATALKILKYLQFSIKDGSTFKNRSAYYHDITAQLHTMGLPVDVVQNIPYDEIANSAVGHKPKLKKDGDKSFWQKAWDGVVNTVNAITDYVYQGLVALENFFEDVWEALVEIGQALLGAISAVLNIIQAALEAIIELIGAIFDWVLEKITSIFDPIIDKILDAIHDWIRSVGDKLEKFMKILDKGGSDSPGASSAAMAVFNEFAGGLLAVSLAILIGSLNWLSNFLLPFGFLITAAVGLIFGIILLTFVKSVSMPGWISDLESSIHDKDASGIIDTIKQKLGLNTRTRSTRGDSDSESMDPIEVVTVFTFILGIPVIIASLLLTGGWLGFAVSVIASILTIVILMDPYIIKNPDLARVLTWIGATLSVAGLIGSIPIIFQGSVGAVIWIISLGLTSFTVFSLVNVESNGQIGGNIFTDNDDMPYWWEVKHNLDPTSSHNEDGNSGDPDGDGLTNYQEYQADTDPQQKDSDFDGLDDNIELDWNVDSDGDGKTNAADSDSDNDLLEDGWEYDYWRWTPGASKHSDISDSRTHYEKWGATNTDADGDGIDNILEDDSDEDGIIDSREVKGWEWKHNGIDYEIDSAGKGFKTDPASINTDGDNADDDEDIHPLYNIKVQIELISFKLGNTGKVGALYDEAETFQRKMEPIFNVVIDGNSEDLTPNPASGNSYSSLGLSTSTYDVSDKISDVDIDIHAEVSDDDSSDDGMNDALDISGVGGNYYNGKFNMMKTSETVLTDGYNDWERPLYDADMKFEIKRILV